MTVVDLASGAIRQVAREHALHHGTCGSTWCQPGVLRATLHPQGLAPKIVNLADWREHVLARLQRQRAACGEAVLGALLAELRALPPPEGGTARLDPHELPSAGADDVAVPLVLATPHGRLALITTVTVFGARHEVWLSELAIETLLPADAATAEALRRLHGAGD